MKIILLEFVDEAKILLNKYGKGLFLSKDTITVCLHPHIRVFLKNKGIDSKGTVDYLDNNAQHRIILTVDKLTARLMQKLHLKDGFNLEKEYRELCVHHLRMYLNHFLCNIEILKGIKDKHPVAGFYCCLPKKQKNMYSKKAPIQNEERFLGILAKDFCKINGINFYEQPLKNKHSNFLNIIATRITYQVAMFLAFVEYKFFALRKKMDTKTIIVPAASYNMGNLLKDIKKQHPDVRCIMIWEEESNLRREIFKIYLLLTNFLKRLKKENLLDAIINLDLIRNIFKRDLSQQNNFRKEFDNFVNAINSELRDLLVYDKIPFHHYLAEKVENGLKPKVISLQHTTLVLRNILQQLHPRLLMAMYSRGIYQAMGEISHQFGFYSLNISHGTHVPPNNEFEKIENYHLGTGVILNDYKYVAVQTPWAGKFLDYYGDKRPRIFSGPLLYSEKKDKIRKSLRKEILGIQGFGKIIVHATTQKLRTGMRFHITETLDEYISAIFDLVNAIKSLEDVFLIIRPHPACDLSEEDFLKSLPICNRLRILNNGPFSDMLSIADLLVSYSSTCIEEALQNGIPVVLFDKWQRYNHFNIEETKDVQTMTKKPVYYLTNPLLLAQGIRRIFNIFENNPLKNEDLVDYRYPKEYKSNFFSFVDMALTTEGKK
ncbi:MAG: hypothetical protein PHS93_04475 [Candidatus Omnitrophica bacterium]|nr:hypothetical protein [Candidatus Omnitrophota bacterium]MDD5352406.1 hypothetical protein [Candidatus Omnitrophota bacterium]MDD5550004.1 hypothetical protein [Candidatus Omnitrophota bacterium]